MKPGRGEAAMLDALAPDAAESGQWVAVAMRPPDGLGAASVWRGFVSTARPRSVAAVSAMRGTGSGQGVVDGAVGPKGATCGASVHRADSAHIARFDARDPSPTTTSYA